MYLVKTILFIPRGETEVMTVEIYISDDVSNTGYWNVDNNRILLSPGMYSEFKNLNSQLEQRKFFAGLQMISKTVLQ